MSLFQLLWKERLKESLKSIYLFFRSVYFALPLFFRKPEKCDISQVKKILVIRHDRIGDMVASLPALQALHALIPKAEITVLASRASSQLLQGFSAVQHVKVYEGKENYIRFVKAESFELTINMIPTYDTEPSLMAQQSGARWTIGYNWGGTAKFYTLPAPNYKPDEAFYLSMLRLVQWLIPSGEGKIEFKEVELPLLKISDDEKRFAQQFCHFGKENNQMPVALHPGGNYPSQRWDINSFLDVAEALLNREYPILFFLPVEIEEEKRNVVRKRLQNYTKVRLIEKGNLRELMALLSCCRLLVCNNTGVLHIAAALGVQTVSTMGPTKHKVWMPMGKGHIVFRTGTPCSPCNRAECPDHRCLKEIQSGSVMMAIRNCLEPDEREGE